MPSHINAEGEGAKSSKALTFGQMFTADVEEADRDRDENRVLEEPESILDLGARVATRPHPEHHHREGQEEASHRRAQPQRVPRVETRNGKEYRYTDWKPVMRLQDTLA